MDQIPHIVKENHVSDAFMGLASIPSETCMILLTAFCKILVPLVEKVAEHLTAIDEAHDNQVILFKAADMSP